MRNKFNQQAEYFDREIDYFSKIAVRKDSHRDLIINYFLEKLYSEIPGKRILELGCGTGAYTIPLLKAGYSVTGVDVSQDSLNVCKKMAEKAKVADRLSVISKPIEKLDYSKEFDAVIGKHILHHLDDVEKVAKICFQVLVKGGVAMFMEPNPICPMWAIRITLDLKRKWRIEKGMMHCFPHQLKRKFIDAKFSKINANYYGLLPATLVKAIPWLGEINSIIDHVPVLRGVLALQTIVAKK